MEIKYLKTDYEKWMVLMETNVYEWGANWMITEKELELDIIRGLPEFRKILDEARAALATPEGK